MEEILQRGCSGEYISDAEGLRIWNEAPLGLLMAHAHEARKRMHPGNEVSWIIDRNINYTNICLSRCFFCNFCRPGNHPDAYVLGFDEYDEKIRELFAAGGDQILLQGGLHPEHGLNYYTALFSYLKRKFPRLKLHALGPPEIIHIAGKEKCTPAGVLMKLMEAGLDSLPGAGAEILSDRVRKILSPAKCSTDEWLEVMRQAHRLGLVTSATMMFGHVETIEERIRHLILLRGLQDEKPADAPGFLSFIPWPFQDENTVLRNKRGIRNETTASEYIRLIALSRLMLSNIPNIQASWLTVGKETAQVCLHAGANDFGSVMMEEKVVSGAGASQQFDAEGIQRAIAEAGFVPVRRDQKFRLAGNE